jgi:hypothetical protein
MERAGVGSIPANPDARNVPSFRRWRHEMKLSPLLSRRVRHHSWLPLRDMSALPSSASESRTAPGLSQARFQFPAAPPATGLDSDAG